MEDFGLWFTTGLAHIADWQAYDHLLFLLALCGGYGTKDWKSLLLLITAFTVGHSLTLALAVMELFSFSAAWIEFLIPVTILLSCIWNLSRADHKPKDQAVVHYIMALFFGLIHGLGFSLLLKSMLGKTSSLLQPLFGFNLGIEAGQILIVVGTLVLGFIVHRIFRVSAHKWRFFLSSAIFGIALIMALERIPL